MSMPKQNLNWLRIVISNEVRKLNGYESRSTIKLENIIFLVNRTVEIIVLPLNDQVQIQDAWPVDFFEATAGCMAEDPIYRVPQCA